MYTSEERNAYFTKAIKDIESIELVDGIVQLGSGVIGYNDEYSDIDLMVATPYIDNAEVTKNLVRETLGGFQPKYIKEKQLRQDIFLLIVFMNNGLEFNISIVPREFLSVKSPLWKVIVDKSGLVTEKMNAENDVFINKPVKYNLGFDVAFEFVYCTLALEKELKRNNLIYALRMLEDMRYYTLLVQALNEDKKLHQFKAYETLEPEFVKLFLSSFTGKVTIDNVRAASDKLKELFVATIDRSSQYSIDPELERLLGMSKIENRS